MRYLLPWLWLAACSIFLPCPARAEESSGQPAFFLPQNPIAAAYVLSRFSNQELIQAPRSEFVYVALLQRPGLETKYRTEALEGLSEIRHSDPLTELLGGVGELDKKGESANGILQELGPLVLRFSAPELLAKRSVLENLAFRAQLPLTRQLSFAAILTADRSINPLWQQVTNAQLADLLFAIPMVRETNVLGECYPKVEPLIRNAATPEIRRGAIAAIVKIPSHDSETFSSLADLVETGTERSSAIASLQRIPRSAWPKERLETLSHALITFLEGVPAAERTDVSFTRALQFASDLISFLPTEESRQLGRVLRGLGPVVFVIRPVYEQLRYDRQLIVVEAGKPVAIILENQDAMPHNLAIVSPGALEEIGLLSEKMGTEPDAQGRLYVPASPKVLHATKLVAPGQKTELAFIAPTEPGEYPYVCTFPGHWRRMVGVMAVVNDVDAYLAKDALEHQAKITEWKLEDLSPELSKVGFGRNLNVGKELFTKLACAQCHKLGEQGYAYGPELTDVFKRYQGDRARLLTQILEPSKVIEDRYRTFEFELKDGDPVAGMIVKEDAQNLTIQSGPSDSLVQTLKKTQIQNRRSQVSSPMPLGLLNTLSKDQILDLLAFVERGGEAPVHVHSETSGSASR